ncbi:hypothetical protein [Microcoleus sp.]|uniref:hypothetical protein n=1 Tax=Microcoleus sp. TaxID=44472 RepID=UPI0035236405
MQKTAIALSKISINRNLCDRTPLPETGFLRSLLHPTKIFRKKPGFLIHAIAPSESTFKPLQTL